MTRSGKTKPKAQRKEEQIRIRVTSDQRSELLVAAEREGLDISAWARSVLLKAARRGTE